MDAAKCVASREKALKAAAKMANLSGPDFLPKLFQNSSWYPSAISKNGYWRIHRSMSDDGIYTAFLGFNDSIGGIWAESDDTPSAAIEKTMRTAVNHVAGLAKLIDCILVNRKDVHVIGPEVKMTLTKSGRAKLESMLKGDS
jgi:hypothetical protein